MQKKLLSILLLNCICGYSQTELSFEYDKAGNQIYRGEYVLNTGINNSANPNSSAGMSPEEIAFWKKIEVGPNPTIDVLVIKMNEEAKREINYFVLYDLLGNPQYTYYNNRITQLQNIELDMRRYPIGMYVLSFYLVQGNVFSKHISKY